MSLTGSPQHSGNRGHCIRCGRYGDLRKDSGGSEGGPGTTTGPPAYGERGRGVMGKAVRLLGLVLDLLLLGASLGTGGPVGDGIRVLAVVVAAMLGAVFVFVVACFAVGLLAQRQPPYV